MRVAFLLQEFPKLSETFISSQVTRLLEAGVDLELLSWKRGTSSVTSPEKDIPGLTERIHYLEPSPHLESRLGRGMALLTGTQGWRNPGPLLRALALRQSNGARARLVYAAAHLLRGKPFDVVHCQFGQLGIFALALRHVGALPGKLVVSFRGADLTQHGDSEGYAELFQAADLFLPVCEAFSERLLAMGCAPEKIRVHPSGIDVGAFAFSPPTHVAGEPLRVLSVARLVEKKGLEYAVRAIALMASEGRVVDYTIVGDGPLRAELTGLAGALGVDDRVHFVGEKSGEGVMRALARTHVLVAPSVTAASGDQEGIPNVLKEAMACGIPVVSTWHSGIPELVDHALSGFLVPERDARALAVRLTTLMDHPELWGAMGREGRRKVQADYDGAPLTEALMGHYEALREPAARPLTHAYR